MDSKLARSVNEAPVAPVEPLPLVLQSSLPGRYQPASPPGEGAFLLDYWSILKKRKWILAAFLVIFTSLATLVTLRMTPIYDAVGRVAINRENPMNLGLKDDVGSSEMEDFDYNVVLETQIRILQSDAIAAEVIRKFRLMSNPAFMGANKVAAKNVWSPSEDSQQEAATQSALIDRLRSGLKINVIPRTRVIEIHYSHPDPKFAALVVNALETTYIEQNFKTKFDAVTQTSEWLSRQLSDLQLKMETSEEKLVQYQKKNGIIGFDDKQNIVTSKLDELNKELTGAENDRIQKQAAYELTLSGNSEMFSQMEPNSLLERLISQENDLKTQYAQATTQYGPAYPKVQEIGNQLKQVEESVQAEIQRIASKLKSEYLAAQGREKMLRNSLEQQKKEANQLNESAIEYSMLKRDADSNRQLYEGLLQRLKEASVTAGLKSTNIRVVDTARVPRSPSSPNVPRNIALGIMMGVVGGIGLIFVLESMDKTVKTPEQAEYISALPSLGIIPLNLKSGAGGRENGYYRRLYLNGKGSDATSGPTEMISFSRPKSEVAESFRALRTAILLSSLGSPPKVIVITSALPQEGKTTTSINSAVVLAQQGGRVLLVDADMRRPGVHRALKMGNQTGLSRLLTGSDQMENVIFPYRDLPNFFVVPAGPTPPQPAELLGSCLMREYLNRWRQEYDHVVVDTPPILTVTDAVLLSVEADSVLMVIRAGKTEKAALRRARDLLVQMNVKVTGIVVNAFDVNFASYYGYYYGTKSGNGYYDETASL
jgi:capsular exopolysaccharide synthesis family protein